MSFPSQGPQSPGHFSTSVLQASLNASTLPSGLTYGAVVSSINVRVDELEEFSSLNDDDDRAIIFRKEARRLRKALQGLDVKHSTMGSTIKGDKDKVDVPQSPVERLRAKSLAQANAGGTTTTTTTTPTTTTPTTENKPGAQQQQQQQSGIRPAPNSSSSSSSPSQPAVSSIPFPASGRGVRWGSADDSVVPTPPSTDFDSPKGQATVRGRSNTPYNPKVPQSKDEDEDEDEGGNGNGNGGGGDTPSSIISAVVPRRRVGFQEASTPSPGAGVGAGRQLALSSPLSVMSSSSSSVPSPSPVSKPKLTFASTSPAPLTSGGNVKAPNPSPRRPGVDPASKNARSPSSAPAPLYSWEKAPRPRTATMALPHRSPLRVRDYGVFAPSSSIRGFYVRREGVGLEDDDETINELSTCVSPGTFVDFAIVMSADTYEELLKRRRRRMAEAQHKARFERGGAPVTGTTAGGVFGREEEGGSC